MRSFNRLIWLLMLLCLAALAISTTVRCLTEEKSFDLNEDLSEDGLDNLEYDSLDESENESGNKPDYGSQSSPQAPPPPPPQPPVQAYYQSPPQQGSHQAPTQAYSSPSDYSPPAQQNYYQPIQHQNYAHPSPIAYNPVPLPNYTTSDYGTSTYLTTEPIVYTLPQQQQQQSTNYYAPPPPALPQSSYESLVPAYQPPSYQPPIYQPQATNYSTGAYQQSGPAYTETILEYQPVQVPSYQQQQVAYQAPIVQTYSTPSYQQPQQQVAYQVPVAQNYSAPAVQPQSYQQQSYPTQSYQQPQQQVAYQTPVVQNYSTPAVQPQSYQQQSYPTQSYQQPQQQVAYQAPVVQNYSAPVVQENYQQQPNYVQPPSYQKPIVVIPPPPVYHPVPVQQRPSVVQNYSSAQTYQKPVQQAAVVYQKPVVPTVYRQSSNQQYVPSMIQKYSIAELSPLLTLIGYRSNHWSLYYYRGAQSPYLQRQCPKNPYLSRISYRDIEQAFLEASSQLGQYRQPSYSNASHPSFASRHQIFSLLSQQSARMDEEGLLVEIASHYLADRLCLTKWDKQRYLPQLTKFVSTSQFPATHSCNNYYRNPWQGQAKQCYQSKYRTYDGFCNNPYHPYWGKSNVCHIRLLSPDYADGISLPRTTINQRYPLPNPRQISNYIHDDVPLDGPYNMMKMQWGQFINHDITNTALSSYDGLVDCCRQPQTRGCWPIYVPPGDHFYGPLNVTCLNFIRSGVCPICQLGPRQQSNKNTAFLDASHVYGNTQEQAVKLRTFHGGLLRSSSNRLGEQLLPVASSQEQCFGTCYQAGDSRVNQHPALTALHTLLLRNHNLHAQRLAQRHPDWNDEYIFQEARRINIAEYQMITYNEYFPIVFGPILSAYYQLTPHKSGHTYYNHQVDPTTWNEYSTATCRFGHSQIQSTFGLYSRILGYGQQDRSQQTFRLKDWFMRPSLLNDGQLVPIMKGLLARPSATVDPWITNDVRNHLYQSHREHSGGDLAATNIWRGRDHGLPGYVHYVEYCFNHKVRGWRDLALFIPPTSLNQLRRLYRVVENIDLFTGGMAERHFPGADTGPTFACVNGIQYYHLKFGDRYYFEHGGQAGSFTPPQLDEIRRSSLARLLCRTAYLPSAPQYAFLAPSLYNPLVNCSQIAEFNYSAF